jgi:hypothetical protein
MIWCIWISIAVLAVPTFFMFCVQTWISYIAIINLWEQREHLDTWVKVLIYPRGWLGVLQDIHLNLWFSIICLDPPHELFLTQRLSRYLKEYGRAPVALHGVEKWRFDVAVYICHNLLDPFAPNGKHCE